MFLTVVICKNCLREYIEILCCSCCFQPTYFTPVFIIFVQRLRARYSFNFIYNNKFMQIFWIQNVSSNLKGIIPNGTHADRVGEEESEVMDTGPNGPNPFPFADNSRFLRCSCLSIHVSRSMIGNSVICFSHFDLHFFVQM